MAAASPWFYTHYSSKNWFYGGDNHLYASRWEELIANRDKVDIVELISWNDYGESHYMGPIEGAQPGSQAWVDGFDHTAWLDVGKMYARVFKTGSWDAVTTDSVFMWSRPHPANTIVTSDALGKPFGWDWTADYAWALVFARAPLSVTLTSGVNVQTFTVSSGITKLKVPSAGGSIRATLSRNGQVVVDVAPSASAFSYTLSPKTYNYNAFVAAGIATGSGGLGLSELCVERGVVGLC
jgi:glucan endo-1,3-alpha-glucosidase